MPSPPKNQRGDPGVVTRERAKDREQISAAALVPFLRRYDPDQVQGFDCSPSQRLSAHPSEWLLSKAARIISSSRA